jgi:hypothetical protein
MSQQDDRPSRKAHRRRVLRVLTGASAVLGGAALVIVASPARIPAARVLRHLDASVARLTSDTQAPAPGSGGNGPAGKSSAGKASAGKALSGEAPSGEAFTGVAAVGALFPAGSRLGSIDGLVTGGPHFCTASVVHSPAGDLAVTAAHCADQGPMVFVPGYHDGIAPYGTWQVLTSFTDSQWQSSQNPDDDVAFLQLAPSADGKSIEGAAGAELLATGRPEAEPVTVIGYPEATDEPVTCDNKTKAFSPTQLEFDCGGYPNGTSGGPFLTDVNAVTGAGTVIGVIGGYQQGGDTDAVSYSIVFGSAVQALYQQAMAAG